MIRLPIKKVCPRRSSPRPSDGFAREPTTPTLPCAKSNLSAGEVGDELVTNGLLALAMVIVGIIIYLSVRFEWRFAVAAIIANMHDVIIILGFSPFPMGILAHRAGRYPCRAGLFGQRIGGDLTVSAENFRKPAMRNKSVP